MSNKPVEPGDIVNDGVEGAQKPVPREGSGIDTPQTAAGTPESGTSGTQAPGKSDSQTVPGPAEEDDEKTADDRGLTTDTTPD